MRLVNAPHGRLRTITTAAKILGVLPLLAVLASCGMGLSAPSSSGGSTSGYDGPNFTDKFDAGDCIGYLATRNIKVDCGTQESTDKVVKVVHKDLSDAEAKNPAVCPGDGSLTINKVTYCTILDVKPGDCLTQGGEHGGSQVKVLCTAKGKKDKVTKVLPKPDGADLCDDGESAYHSPTPPQTVCVVEVK